MKTIFATIFALGAAALLGGVVFIYSGVVSVAALEPHSAPVYWLMEATRTRSIKVHAAGIVAPAALDREANIVQATGHFAAHCAVCHGAPGTKRDDFVLGMYPQPPDLTDASKRYTRGELFWIMKNGIKMSGMPAMADDGDEMLWSTVALIEKLPGMSDDDYNDLWMAAQAQGHDQMMKMHGMGGPPASTNPGKETNP